MSSIKLSEPETDGENGSREADFRAGQVETVYVRNEQEHTDQSQRLPKPHGESGGIEVELGSVVLDKFERSMKIEDQHSHLHNDQQQQPVFTRHLNKPAFGQTVPGFNLPLPADAVKANKLSESSHTPSNYPIQEQTLSSSEPAAEGVIAGKSEFEILNVKDRSSSTSSTNTLRNQVDAPSPVKYPKQIQDVQGRSWGYADILKGQFQQKRQTRGISRVEPGCFPSYNKLDPTAGLLIYSTENNLPSEEVYVRRTPSENDYLGHGGNGTVYRFFLRGKTYAVKVTQYREDELNVWSKLDHPNIIPLLGVMMGDQPGNCYHFMPLMSGSLHSMMIDHGNLYTHLVTNEEQWSVILYNTMFVLKEILHGLAYLAGLNIQHCDLKACNILVKKNCSCSDLLHCVCPLANKYIIQISDFDSVKQTTSLRRADQFGNSTDVVDSRRRPAGTPLYRAPEQFKLCPKLEKFEKVLQDGQKHYNMEGPWSDVWSFGILMLQMIMGSQSKETSIKEANFIAHSNMSGINQQVEDVTAVVWLNKLMRLARKHSRLNSLEKMVCSCLEIDPPERAAASQLLSMCPVCEIRLSRCT